MKPFVCFNKVSHQYQSNTTHKVQALTDINFHINKHEFVAVVGPSGCGKSTLLKLITGLMSPSEGSVEIFGKTMHEPRNEVGIVFQKPTLLPWLSVLDNVTFPLKHQHGKVASEAKQYAMTLLKLVGLEQFAHQRPAQLSGGMQQRVGIARALILKPEILIMDEPFSALDALSREIMGFELLRIWEEEPKTVLFITHSINEAVLLADKVLVMSPRPGTVVEELPIDLPRPRNNTTLKHEKFAYYADILRDHIFQKHAALNE
ncbi:ABC transporter ATP-binding protein [Marinomonas agarivorans]|nr:ABC transporter ATP-binding protein [Marinomonas agarivorans]